MRSLKRPLLAGLAGLAVVLLAGALFQTAQKTSLVYDEVIYAPVGLMYLKNNDFRWNSEHPPLQKMISALPLAMLNVEIPTQLNAATDDPWRAGYQILFQQNKNAQNLIASMRTPTIFLTLALALLVFFTARQMFGDGAGILALGTFAFDPLVLGNGALAMNDMFVTFFFFTGWCAFQNYYFLNRKRWLLVLSGVLWGLAVASKFSALIFAPALIGFLWIMPNLEQRNSSSRDNVHIVSVIGITAFLTVLAVYRFDLKLFWDALHAGTHVRSINGTTGYLLTPISGSSTWFYYPVTLLIKTPLPLLALWVLSLFALAQKSFFKKSQILWIVFPVGIVFGAALFMHNHFGLRYLLPAIPLMAILVGAGYSVLSSRNERILFGSLLSLLAINAVVVTPHAMAYFNEVVGGSKNGYKWLDGSNQDWGQDLPSLAALIDAQPIKPAICMGYWGSNQPETWGIEYQDVFSPAITNKFREETVNDPRAAREWLIVSAYLRTNQTTRNVYEWLKDRTPIAFVGNTLFVYDITTDEESVQHLQTIYRMMGRTVLEQRQQQRLDFLRSTAVVGTASSK